MTMCRGNFEPLGSFQILCSRAEIDCTRSVICSNQYFFGSSVTCTTVSISLSPRFSTRVGLFLDILLILVHGLLFDLGVALSSEFSLKDVLMSFFQRLLQGQLTHAIPESTEPGYSYRSISTVQCMHNYYMQLLYYYYTHVHVACGFVNHFTQEQLHSYHNNSQIQL